MDGSIDRRLASAIGIALAGMCIYLFAQTDDLATKLDELRAGDTTRHESLEARLAEIISESEAARSQLAHLDAQFRRIDSDLLRLGTRLTGIEGRLEEIEAQWKSLPSSLPASTNPADAPREGEDLLEVEPAEEPFAGSESHSTEGVLLSFESLPEWAREKFEGTEDRAAYIAGPENRWGIRRIGAAHVRLKGQETWEILPADEHALLTRFAELSHRLEQAEARRIEELVDAGRALRYDTAEPAKAYLDRLAAASPTGETGKILRVDPSTGEAWVIHGDDVRLYPQVYKLQEQRRLIGELILAGRSGSFGVKWIRPPA